ncbi:phospholipid transport system transporter-binding protein [Silvimonas terrae]|uniref:Phospholipid transport system transporter-binding protein n=1 Tax=Silvimonas terrae TaxID=300266 RepID=A0A840RLZ5_9NEIS|nr:STAS domain-containing protein [Silvimonas terrae]MBB5193121.1 phospholipid transport system transporter-binding protein [Silvimonas terrae]
MSDYTVTGNLTMLTASKQLAAFVWPEGASELTLNLGQLGEVDSAAVSVLLHWQRIARTRKARLEIKDMPIALAELIRLYGVQSLLPAGV